MVNCTWYFVLSVHITDHILTNMKEKNGQYIAIMMVQKNVSIYTSV